MRSTFVIFAAVLLLTVGLAAPAREVALAQGDSVGPEVPIIDEEGVTRGTISVREYEDPFSGADPAAVPAEGMRFVGLIVAFTAADDQTLPADAHRVLLHDSDGYLYQPSYVQRPADVLQPDLQSQELAPGNRISGFIGYNVPLDAELDEVIYTPDTYRAISIFDVRGTPGPMAGEPASIVAADGGQASVTVILQDPFVGFEPSLPPEPGVRFVGLLVVFENVGSQPFRVDPNQLYLRMADGSLHWPTNVQRPAGFSEPNLGSVDTGPGDRISGFVGYAVPETATIVGVDLWPSGDRRSEIVDVGADGPMPASDAPASPSPQASAAPQTSPTPSAPPEPEASLTPSPSAGVAT